jgi:hypothetical protein
MRLFLPFAVFTVSLMTGQMEANAYSANGSGTLSCGSWTANRRAGADSALQAEQWVLGFLSGIGFVSQNGDDPLKHTDPDGVWGWMDNYCGDHPIRLMAPLQPRCTTSSPAESLSSRPKTVPGLRSFPSRD